MRLVCTSGTEQEERRKEGRFVSLLRSKDSNIHAATEDLSFNIMLKRVTEKKTQKVREGFFFLKSKKVKSTQKTKSQNLRFVKMEINWEQDELHLQGAGLKITPVK